MWNSKSTKKRLEREQELSVFSKTSQSRYQQTSEKFEKQVETIARSLPPKSCLIKGNALFRHPLLRIFSVAFLIVLHFILLGQDPIMDSFCEARSETIGRIGHLLLTGYSSESILASLARWLLISVAFVLGCFVGRNWVQQYILRDRLKLWTFSSDRGSWLIAGVFAMAALYCVSYVYASVINKAVDREDLGFTNQEYGKLFLIVAASCDCWLLIGTIDDCLQDVTHFRGCKAIKHIWRNSCKGWLRVVFSWLCFFLFFDLTIIAVVDAPGDQRFTFLSNTAMDLDEIQRAWIAVLALVTALWILFQDNKFPVFVEQDEAVEAALSTLPVEFHSAGRGIANVSSARWKRKEESAGLHNSSDRMLSRAPFAICMTARCSCCHWLMKLLCFWEFGRCGPVACSCQCCWKSGFWRVSIYRKWMLYAPLLFMFCFDAHTLLNQVFYYPAAYSQYTDPSTDRLWSVRDPILITESFQHGRLFSASLEAFNYDIRRESVTDRENTTNVNETLVWQKSLASDIELLSGARFTGSSTSSRGIISLVAVASLALFFALLILGNKLERNRFEGFARRIRIHLSQQANLEKEEYSRISPSKRRSPRASPGIKSPSRKSTVLAQSPSKTVNSPPGSRLPAYPPLQKGKRSPKDRANGSFKATASGESRQETSSRQPKIWQEPGSDSEAEEEKHDTFSGHSYLMTTDIEGSPRMRPISGSDGGRLSNFMNAMDNSEWDAADRSAALNRELNNVKWELSSSSDDPQDQHKTGDWSTSVAMEAGGRSPPRRGDWHDSDLPEEYMYQRRQEVGRDTETVPGTRVVFD